MRRNALFQGLVIALIWLSMGGTAAAQSYGLDAPVAVGAFLNGVLPPRTPHALGSSQWAIGAAFPNLPAVQDSMVITPSPNPADDRLYVAARDGEVVSFHNNANVASVDPFLDLRDRVAVLLDGGFYNLVFHPQFGQAGSPFRKYVYVYYSSYCAIDATKNTTDLNNCNPNYPPDGEAGFFGVYLRLSRFEVPDGATAANKTTEKVLINIRLYNTTHRGGGMVFGNDGLLYLMIGEQYISQWAQDIVSGLHGGSFRLAVDVAENPNGTWTCPSGSHAPPRIYTGSDEVSGRRYCIPNDNPWLDPGGGLFEEYYSLGHRNPYRLTKDTATGRLWSGEVGAATREEVNIIEKGNNYGWPFREGFTTGIDPPPLSYLGVLTDPVIDFKREEANAIVGGYVYRGTRFPELVGKYLAGDYVTGLVWAITLDEATMTATQEELTSFDQYAIVTWGQDRQGEVYLGSIARPINTLQRLTSPVEDPPALLSQLGAFTNLPTLVPASFWVPYRVNPFWSDGAEKSRWIAVPNNGVHDTPSEKIAFSADSNWDFPTGTVLMKHFELPLDENDPSVTARLETRFLVNGDDGKWYGVTYRWRPDRSDADLINAAETQDYTIQLNGGGTRSQTWLFPSRTQCVRCHSDAAGGALGPRTHQINRELSYPSTGRSDNQLRTWNHLGMFSPSLNEASIPGLLKAREIDDVTASLEDRSRGWLDSNCSYCHRPDTGNRAFFDARLTTPLPSQILVNGGVINDLGIPGAKVVKPANTTLSVLYQRVAAVGGIAMPPLAKSLADDPALEILGAWIERIPPNAAQGGVAYEFFKTPPASVDALASFNFQNPTSIGQIANFDISPAEDPDWFVFRFTGQLKVDTAGSYTFFTSSDDGSRLWVDGALVVDNDGLHALQERSGTLTLSAGYHQIVVAYLEWNYGQSLLVEWQGPGITRQAIPSNRLFLVVPPTLVNNPPSLSNPGNQTSREGQSTLLDVSASDPDGNALYFDASGLPSGLSIDHQTGEVSGVAGTGTVGDHAVTIGVSDGPAAASAALTWTVLPNQCGDGVVWGAESCDDGNTASDDGCSNACGVVMGWSCDGANPTVCLPVCSDNIDNDGDGLVDFPNDPGCRDSSSKNEKPQCQDGRDNDGDGAIDFDGGAAANGGVALGAPDMQCNLPSAIEQGAGCGFGLELAFGIPLLSWLRDRRSRRA